MTALRCAAFAIIVAALTAITSPARADSIGIIVSGDVRLRGQLEEHVEAWLKNHAYELADNPLDMSGFGAFNSCFLVDDLDCARRVIDERAAASAIAYVRVTTAGSDLDVAAWWFVKGHDVSHDHARCAGCAPDGWPAVVDTLLVSVTSGSTHLGHLDVRSHPSSVAATLDGRSVGTTPVAIDVAAGDHVITLERGSLQLARHTLTITAGETTAIDIPVRPPPASGSQATGAASHRELIIGLAAGLVLAGVLTGVVLYERSDHGDHSDRAPAHGAVVSVTRGGAFVGYSARF